MSPFLPLMGALLAAASASRPADQFKLHARYVGIGACPPTTIVGPGPTAGSQRIFASHIYDGSTLDIVAIDPDTGKAEVFTSPVKTESAAWTMVVAPNGQLYVGTAPRAHILRLDWPTRRLVDMGQPAPSEEFLWQMAVGSDGKIYGGTYTHCKLIRFDPATGKGEDLGRMDPAEQSVRFVAADDRGFVYGGVGFGKRHPVAYEIATGEHRDILPKELINHGECRVTRSADGIVYATVDGKRFHCDGWVLTAVKAIAPPAPTTLADGRVVTYAERAITLRDPKTNVATTRPVDYAGKPLDFFRIGLGPDGQLYGSTALPIHFIRADPQSDRWEEIGLLGTGELYSFLTYGELLVSGAYSGLAPLIIYRPDKPYAPKADAGGNPWLIHYKDEDAGWRPKSLIAGPDGKIYVGAVAGDGQLGGPLAILDPKTGQVQQYRHVVKDQSVVALTTMPDGLIAGGTTRIGGTGSTPVTTNVHLFLWDPDKKEKVFEVAVAPKKYMVDALAVGPDGLLYGFAVDTMFVFDPKERKVVDTIAHGLGRVVYEGVASGPDGQLYGVSANGVFTVDTTTRRAHLLAKSPDQSPAASPFDPDESISLLARRS